MTKEHRFVGSDYSDRDLYVSSRTQERAVNWAIVRAEISESFKKYLEIFEAFYADDIEASSETAEVRVVFRFEYSLPSEVSVVSSFIEKFMQLIANHRCVSGNEAYVDIALREALINAVVHGNHEDPRKHVHVDCRCEPDEISILVRDEGQGFDVDRVPDPTAPENIQYTHGRGIYLMRAYMDEVRFEEGGRAVRMRKRAPWNRGADSVKAGR